MATAYGQRLTDEVLAVFGDGREHTAPEVRDRLGRTSAEVVIRRLATEGRLQVTAPARGQRAARYCRRLPSSMTVTLKITLPDGTVVRRQLDHFMVEMLLGSIDLAVDGPFTGLLLEVESDG